MSKVPGTHASKSSVCVLLSLPGTTWTEGSKERGLGTYDIENNWPPVKYTEHCEVIMNGNNEMPTAIPIFLNS